MWQYIKFVLAAVGFISICIIIFFLPNLFLEAKYSNVQPTPILTQEILIPTMRLRGYCNRSTPYKQKAEFGRALGLIMQRTYNNERPFFMFTEGGYRDIINCTQVVYSNSRESFGAEGFFEFNPQKANHSYLPIYVDQNYKEADDILTAVLLSHEMMHALQFLDKLNGELTLSCYDQEVSAYLTQAFFIHSLNKEEINSLESRINQQGTHPQLQIIKKLEDLLQNSLNYCGYQNTNCWLDRFKVNISNMVSSNQFYQEQCKGR